MTNTLILVHGFMDTDGRMAYLSKQLRNKGWKVLTPSLQPSNGSQPIEKMAEKLADFIGKHTGNDERIDLIGFSMGGLICRYYVQFLDGLSRTDRLITISTPHQGTVAAYLLPFAAVKQMRPGSAFLQHLNSEANRLERLIFVSFYTPFDLTILPATSSIVPIARNYKIHAFLHRLMVYDGVLINQIVAMLNLPATETNETS